MSSPDSTPEYDLHDLPPQLGAALTGLGLAAVDDLEQGKLARIWEQATARASSETEIGVKVSLRCTFCHDGGSRGSAATARPCSGACAPASPS